MSNISLKFKKNDILNLIITDISDLGFGIGRHEGIVVFVQGAVPGDCIDARIIKVTSSYLVGRVEKFISKSTIRVADRCTERCHSCAYKDISYPDEVRIKASDLEKLFFTEHEHVRVAPVTPSPREKRYRNKAQYPVSFTNGEYRVGFFAPKTHRVTPVSDCPLTPEIFSEICAALCEHFKKHSVTVYDEESGNGLLRHVYLRKGELSDEILLTIVVNGDSLPASDELCTALRARFPSVVGILLNVNRRNTNVILGDTYITLFGRDYIYDSLCDVRLKLSAPAFYQVNHDAAELLYKKARELAELKETDTLLDLYCGVGSIGLSMARDVKELIGIEIVDSAVACANENAALNGFGNARFFVGDAKNTEKLLCRAEEELGHKIAPDVVILDPPRSGCDEGLVKFVSSLGARRIIYISCNPKTLSRDLSRFCDLGLIADTVYPFDLFPCTGHIESVVCLTRSDKAT